MAKEQGTGSRGLCDPVPGDHRPRLATQPVHEGHHRPPAGFKRRFHLRSPVGGRRWKPEYCRPPAPGQPLTPRRESGMGRGFILILSSWVLPCHPERSEGSSRPNERDPSVATLPQDDKFARIEARRAMGDVLIRMDFLLYFPNCSGPGRLTIESRLS